MDRMTDLTKTDLTKTIVRGEPLMVTPVTPITHDDNSDSEEQEALDFSEETKENTQTAQISQDAPVDMTKVTCGEPGYTCTGYTISHTPISDINVYLGGGLTIQTNVVSKPVQEPVPVKPALAYTNLHSQYDNIHGCISISQIAKAITQHKYFTRLKDIHQLGPLHFKFPYADHSRFEHSIGVAYLARHACTQLRGKHPEITDREVLCVEIAGLCHDLGHGAYSHSFDHLLRELGVSDDMAHHEARSQLLTKKVIESLNADGTTDIPAEDIELIQYFIDPDKFLHIYGKKPTFFAGLEQIVSNPVHKVDVDKMDYLLRDAQALRFDQTLKYTLDIVGLLNRAQIINGMWMFHIRDQGIVYDLICRRFIFYNNCYLHPDVNAV